MAKPKILVAGFGPFPGAPKNPSGQLALAVANSRRAAASRATIVGAGGQMNYRDVFSKLSHLLETEKPDAVLMFGLAGGTSYMRVETRAANMASGVYPDASGQKPRDRSLVPGAPHIGKVRAPIRQLLAAARKAGMTARLSVDAGGYICNAAFFHCLDAARRTGTPKFIAFVHIPWPRGRHPRKAQIQKAKPPTLGNLNRAGEEILLALISAARLA
jgi:pyroglutamyl-peptidase